MTAVMDDAPARAGAKIHAVSQQATPDVVEHMRA